MTVYLCGQVNSKRAISISTAKIYSSLDAVIDSFIDDYHKYRQEYANKHGIEACNKIYPPSFYSQSEKSLHKLPKVYQAELDSGKEVKIFSQSKLIKCISDYYERNPKRFAKELLAG